MPSDPLTPERLEAIRAAVADVERRAGRIAAWKAMPHPFAVESGLRTQGLRAPRLAADVRDLLAEVERLQAEAERLQMQVVACGVVALADTSESARQARDMHPDCRSASCEDVARMVDALIDARAEVGRLQAEAGRLWVELDERDMRLRGANARVRIHREQRDAALAVLRAVEWGGPGGACPACQQWAQHPGVAHRDDCALAACLRAAEVSHAE